MFGILLDIVEDVCEVVDDVVGIPIASIVATPVTSGLDLLDGLTEGEIRTKAALKLGVSVVAGMAIGEVVEYLSEE